MPDVSRVAIVGAGDMGHGIALVFASGGFDVVLEDKFPDVLAKAKGRIAAGLDRLVLKGKMTKEQAFQALSRIEYSGSVGDAVSNAGLVVEAVPESVALKREVLAEVCSSSPPDAIVASNTSTIMISELASGLSRPERVVGMHFFNPPASMKLVEVVPGAETDPAVCAQVEGICRRIGKTPVRVRKDSPGFIVDRVNAADSLLFCLLLDRGLVTPESADAFARSQGLPMGPYELLDFVGLDVARDSLAYFARTVSPEYGKGVAFGKMVSEGRLGKKSGRGFYEWTGGRAVVPDAKPTDKVSIMDIFAVEINEAVKLVEEGVAGPEDIEKSVTLGMNRPFGPISDAKDLTNSEVKAKLEELASRFECGVFAPAAAIAGGRLRDAIEGRLAAPEAGPSRTQQSPSSPEAGAAANVVRVERFPAGVARIMLCRPKYNLISAEVLDALDKAVTELWNDSEVRVVVVTGEGEVLSAGADLSQYFGSSYAFEEFCRKGARIMKRLSEIPKLTISVMKGYALGGGLELALACDLRFATEDVEIGFPEVSRGLVPAWSGSQRLPKLLGAGPASAMILAGERIRGRRAFEIGLAGRLALPGDPDEQALAYATELASSQAPVALALAKRLINRGAEVPADVGLELEAMAAGVLFGTEDLKEGVGAFLGKRKPHFKGK